MFHLVPGIALHNSILAWTGISLKKYFIAEERKKFRQCCGKRRNNEQLIGR
jgi:hypothetical protein